MSESLATVAYIGAAILFILSLGGLSNPETSRRGNFYGIVGMTIAVLASAGTTLARKSLLPAIQKRSDCIPYSNALAGTGAPATVVCVAASQADHDAALSSGASGASASPTNRTPIAASRIAAYKRCSTVRT